MRCNIIVCLALLAFATDITVATKNRSGSLTTGCDDFNTALESTVKLDLTKYDGVWYEQVRTRHSPFETKCFCSQANYTIADDGSVTVDNVCREGSAASPETNAIGRAVVPDEEHPGYLLLSFGIPFLKAPYEVLDTDYENYSIIASCPRIKLRKWHIWILTREQQPHPEFIEELKNRTVAMGFSSDTFVDTYQGDHCNDEPGVDFSPVVTWYEF